MPKSFMDLINSLIKRLIDSKWITDHILQHILLRMMIQISSKISEKLFFSPWRLCTYIQSTLSSPLLRVNIDNDEIASKIGLSDFGGSCHASKVSLHYQ